MNNSTITTATLVLAIGGLDSRKEDLTENFCTNNENVEQLRKLNAVETAKRK